MSKEKIENSSEPKDDTADEKIKDFFKTLASNQIPDEHPLSSEQLWDLYS